MGALSSSRETPSAHAAEVIASRVARPSSKLRDVLVRVTGPLSPLTDPKLSRLTNSFVTRGSASLTTGDVNARRGTGRTSVLDVTDTVESDPGEIGDTGDALPSEDLRGGCRPVAPSLPGVDPDVAENCAVSAREARALFVRPVGRPWACWGAKLSDVGLVGDAGIGLRLAGVCGVRGV